jgi:hypothetical protein
LQAAPNISVVRRNAVNARDAGLDLIGRINRWMVAGAVVVTGAVSVAAAKSFHGHSTTGSASTATQSSGSAGSSSNSGSGLQQPPSAPSVAGPASAPVISSGGS